ncbi:MAG: hypothetical protein KC618_05360 [Candidatus Omnitrophica bacterium]|nr:hypothetical protein [Candidatus Omnitrophota bacterium]
MRFSVIDSYRMIICPAGGALKRAEGSNGFKILFQITVYFHSVGLAKDAKAAFHRA